MCAKVQWHKQHDELRQSKEDYKHLQRLIKVQDEIFFRRQLTSCVMLLHMLDEYFLKSVSYLVKNSQSFACEIVSNLLSQKTENYLFGKEDLWILLDYLAHHISPLHFLYLWYLLEEVYRQI